MSLQSITTVQRAEGMMRPELGPMTDSSPKDEFNHHYHTRVRVVDGQRHVGLMIVLTQPLTYENRA